MNKEVANQAKELYLNCGSCGYAIIETLKCNYPKLKDLDPFLIEGFGGGFAGNGHVCGVYSAATLALSKIYVKEISGDNRGLLFGKLNECYDRIQDGFNGFTCKEVCGCDFSIAEELKIYKAEKFAGVCADIVYNAALVISDYIDEDE